MTTNAPATDQAHHHEAHAHGEHHAHVVSARVFLNVLIALLILTVITVAVSRVDFGAGNMLVAMAVAVVKASLVMAIFMHLRWDTAINNLFFLSSFILLSLLFLFTYADNFDRGELESRHDRTAPLPLVGEYITPGTTEKVFFDHLATLKAK